MELYIYVCYEIVDRDDEKQHFIVDFGGEDSDCESFTSMNKAVKYCKENYATYMIAIEKCDREVYNEVKNFGK